MVLSNYMTAAVLTGHGGLEKLIVRDNVPVLKPKANEEFLAKKHTGNFAVLPG